MSALPEGHLLGPYRIVRLIGEGGMGAVYEARQEPLDRRVALKTLHPESASNQEAVARFFNEAKVLSRLEHPSIVQVSDFGKTPDGSAYLVMEFLRGVSLSRRLRSLEERGDRLPVTDALQIAFQVADVLAVAHAQGIIHRDLKPDNLMLVADPIATGGERVKILDFGIAKLTKGSDRGRVKTDTNTVMGTPAYMSPEQCAGAGGVDAKTDVYSLGCVLYEMLAGRPPYVADGSGQLIGMHLFQTPPPITSVAAKIPSPVAELVHRLLTRDKKQRPNMSVTADELVRLLSKTSGGASVTRSRPHVEPDPDETHPLGLNSPSTTLGHLTGQRLGGSPALVRKLAVGAVILIVGAAMVLRLASRSALPPKDRPTPPPSAAAQKTLVHWHIETAPQNATVLDESGKSLGTTPWIYQTAAAAGQRRIRLHRDGYLDTDVSIDRSNDFDHNFPLAPTPDPSPTPSPKQQLKRAPNKNLPSQSTPSKQSRIGYEE